MTTLYERFRASIDRDGFDASIIQNARGDARDQLEDDLIANPEYYEAYALAMLKSVKAVPKLKQHLPISSDSTKVAIARALWDIEQYAEAPAVIASVLTGDAKSTSWSTRIDAAYALRDIHQPQVIAALGQALFDEEYLVRCNAAHALAANRGRRVSDDRIVAAVSDGDQEKNREIRRQADIRSRSSPRQTLAIHSTANRTMTSCLGPVRTAGVAPTTSQRTL
jgi:HEAT repeat protein